MNGKGYLGKGLGAQTQDSAEVFGDIWEYDASANIWSRTPAVGGPAGGAAVGFVLASRSYVGTGMNEPWPAWAILGGQARRRGSDSLGDILSTADAPSVVGQHCSRVLLTRTIGIIRGSRVT